VAAVAALLIAGFAYHPPMMVVTPLKPIDISQDVTVTGTPVHGVHGRYLLLPVRLDRPSAWSALLAVASRRRRFPIRGRAPSVSELAEVRRQDEELFRQAQQEAAVAGARAAGIDVHAGGDGARVVQLAGSSGSLALRPDDVITAVNGAVVHLGSDVEGLVRGHQGPGASVLTVEREGRTVFVPVPLPSGRGGQGRLPVVLETRHASFSLPFRVSFRSRPIGGPSGGLVYALLLADMLGSHDLAHGRTVAATGAVDSSGVVSAVGFVAEKGEAAAGSHAGDFFLPAVQAALVHQASLRPRGVLSVDEAVRALLDQP
jgi:PDZ domain-containing protein